MNSRIQRWTGKFMRVSGLERWPVRVRGGVAAGARWTLYPWTSYWRATHEPSVQAAVAALGGGRIEGWSCWDLGAHYGIYSIGLARRVGPRGQVAAFEPNPISYRRLAYHARINQVPWLKTFPAAVSDQSGVTDLYTDDLPDSNFTHLRYEGERPSQAHPPHRVTTVRLDDWVDSGQLRPPNFVKIDVEGHGQHALAGMQRVLRAHRPILTVAFHSPSEVAGVRALLDPLGYRACRIGPQAAGAEAWVGEDYLFTPAR